jgi:predicted negative regulator of RcsB-dependent stress response
LLQARISVESNELDKAANALKTVMDTTKDKQLALVARLRLARVQLAQGKPDEAIATVNAVDAGAFKARYDVVRGDALFAKGDKAGALREYQAARAGTVTQSVDAQALELKIDDLLADNPTPAADAPPAAANAKPSEAK